MGITSPATDHREMSREGARGMTCHAARWVGEFKRCLRRDRREVRRALVSTDAELTGLERHHPGEFLDDAARETASHVLSNMEERDRRTLEEIDAAEERLGKGTFGVCEACERPISSARLRALPTARHCVECEEAAERRRP